MTFCSSTDNYGQILQCYALQKYLINKGYDAFLINYIPEKNKVNKISQIKYIISHKGYKYFLVLFLRKIFLKGNKTNKNDEIQLFKKNQFLNKKRRFDDFKEKYIRRTEICYHSLSELRDNPPVADVYICGSDQIWNNRFNQQNVLAWYLSFGDDNVIRIAYAAGISGVFNTKELQILKKVLQPFKAIGVRESSSVLLCDKIGYKVNLTLDPTFLIPVEEYRKMYQVGQKNVTPYLFMYILNVYENKEFYWDRFREYLDAKKLDLKIVCSSGYIQARELIEGVENLQATIPEWLRFIDAAQCVVTTSFHGIVFSIRMHKPFLAILLNNQYANGNSRIISLLELLSLSDRIYNPDLSIEKQMENKIDWKKVDDTISSLQIDAYNFLKNNLEF